SVHEARMVREAYLKVKDKVATQMGVQRHALDNMARIVELVKGGAIGAPLEVRLWSGRKPTGGDYLPEQGPIPPGLHWDLWVGPSPDHPFNPEYIKGGCLKWNRFWDFGSGQIGDMGSHIMDIAWWALDLRFPTSCMAEGTPVSESTCPEWLTAEWEHPANDWRPAVKVYWYDADKRPGAPSKALNIEPMGNGAVFKGDKGYLLCDFGGRYLMPKGDLTYYHPPKPEELIPPVKSHHQEWVEACKRSDHKTRADFDYSGTLIEHNLLALAAYRVGKKLEWDAEKLAATNCPEVEPFIKKTYRQGWTLNG
ncbi:MAG: gfo/Idh/MocA family oxidoreductase, partial [Candidatus Sumerlaeota bacterium]|nr:gfo/Idh/MocA family oxidoreductase [Candidatus Sumerlaeota bacterium]